MTVSYRKIGEHLRNARGHTKLTQAEVAEKLNISLNHYGQLERGTKRVTLDMLSQLCELYDVSPEELLHGVFENCKAPSEDVSDEKQIEYISSLIRGCSPEVIKTVTEVVESITRLNRG